MVGDQKSADFVDHAAQLLDLVDAAHVAVEAEGAHVPPFGGDLDPLKQGHAPLARVAVHLRIGPGVVVFGNADAFQPDLVGLVDHDERVEIAVGAAARGVDVEIDTHGGGP